MTDKEKLAVMDFDKYKNKVRRQCPRGVKYFCDGTYNGSDRKINLGPCRFRVDGRCIRLKGED